MPLFPKSSIHMLLSGLVCATLAKGRQMYVLFEHSLCTCNQSGIHMLFSVIVYDPKKPWRLYWRHYQRAKIWCSIWMTTNPICRHWRISRKRRPRKWSNACVFSKRRSRKRLCTCKFTSWFTCPNAPWSGIGCVTFGHLPTNGTRFPLLFIDKRMHVVCER